MPILYPLVNGHRTSYCSIEFAVDGRKIAGVKSINYKEEIEKAKQFGTSANAIGRTRGQSKCSGDIELYEAEWYTLLPLITAGGSVGYGEASHLISVSYSEPGSTISVVSDQLVAVAFCNVERSNSEGTEANTVKVSLDIMSILWDARYRGLSSVLSIFGNM
jgi:hypothetical protein